jgi:TolB-like protein/Tfp pilus assembly protein PilF
VTPESHVPPEHDDATRKAAVAAAAKPVIPDFNLLRRIGQGAYGDVWLARGLTGVYRAIKVVWRDRFPDAGPFEREFRGLQKFTSMSLPESGQLALLHVGQNETAGFFFYVMELADDVETGREVNPGKYAPLTLREVRTRRGRLPAKECVAIGVELARALAGLHSRGLVHRDIKPSNIILVGGVPKLADIGLVAEMSEALTYVGTQGFMPPEGPGKPAADVYALGHVLYELATGLDRDEYPRLPAELGKLADRKELLAFNEIILRACEPDPARRYPDAQALLADLLVLQGGSSVRRQRTGIWSRRAGLALAVALVLAAGASLWRTTRPASAVDVAPPSLPATAAKSVAVLAFTNLGEDKGDENFSDGISEELLNVLAKVPGLRVTARTSSFFFKGRNLPMAEIAQKLNVGYLIEGSVQRAGDRVRISAQLVRAADGTSLWSEHFDRELKDIFALEDEIAGYVATNLSLKLGLSSAASRAAVDPRAFELYLQGRQAWNLRTTAGFARAEELFGQALAREPDFARAEAAIADVWLMRSQEAENIDRFDQRHSAGQERILAKIREALALDANSAEAHASLGMALATGWRFAEAEVELRRAVELNPSYASAHQWLGRLLVKRGLMDEALAELKLATELDPLSSRIIANYANELAIAGRWRDGIAECDRALAVRPDELQATWGKAMALVCLGRRDEAVALFHGRSPDNPIGREFQVMVLAKAGMTREAEALMPSLEPNTPLVMKMACELALGRRAEAIAMLDPGPLTTNLMDALLFDSLFDPLRGEPKFAQVLGEVGLTEANARAQAWRAHQEPEPVAVLPAPPVPEEKSLAVLPFENLSDDKENGYFADGIHEEILTDLGNIAALHIISRTSVMQYRGTTKTIGQIARELGVDFILEGSVRRVGQKVRVTGQLIRAAADEQIWAKAYDGDLSDILALQAQVATAIAAQLKAVLTPEETKRLSAISLADPQAYELYLRAKELRRRDTDHNGFGPNPEAESLLQKATEVDPKFALPWSELASIHIEHYFNDNRRLDLRDLAKREVDLALALAPGRAEPQAGLGEYFYYGFYDYENAAKYLRKALEFEPSDAEAHRLLALVYRRQSRWRDAIFEFSRAHELDPLYRPLTAMLRNAYYCVHAYPEGEALVVAQAKIEPEWLENRMAVAFFEANITSSRRPLEEFFATLTPAERETAEAKEMHRSVEFDSGDAAKFLELAGPAQAGSDGNFDDNTINQPAIARRVLGRDPAEILTRNRALLEEAARANPSAEDWQALALTCALQGDKARAEFSLQRAAERIHPDKDPLDGFNLEVSRAQMLAWLGDKAGATDLLASLVRKPGLALGAFELKFSLIWWPLRGDPRFEALLADPATYHPKY